MICTEASRDPWTRSNQYPTGDMSPPSDFGTPAALCMYEAMSLCIALAVATMLNPPLYPTGHGLLTDVQEGDFIEITTTTPHVVCHFFHRDFERCKILDKHLAHLATKYFDTKFIKLSAPVSGCTTLTLSAWLSKQCRMLITCNSFMGQCFLWSRSTT